MLANTIFFFGMIVHQQYYSCETFDKTLNRNVNPIISHNITLTTHFFDVSVSHDQGYFLHAISQNLSIGVPLVWIPNIF